MTELLPNHVGGRWQTGSGAGVPLFDPVLGTELARVDATGLDLPAAFGFARDVGGAALRALSYRQRAGLLAAVVKVLQTHRDSYYEIATANSGTVKNDSAVDIDGAIFTLGQYVKWGDALGDVHALRDGDAVKLGKEPRAASRSSSTPSTSRPGACGRRRPRPCCRACPSSSSLAPRPPGSRSAWCATWSTPACCPPVRCR
jgi:3,4-dehydroadipyl-CoA semialdehyde dehydrogenase